MGFYKSSDNTILKEFQLSRDHMYKNTLRTFLLLSLASSACTPALPNDDPDIQEFKNSDASVKKMLEESYQFLKKSESHLLESREILKQVKEVEQSILLEKKSSQASLAQAKKERLEADKIRKHTLSEKRRIAKEVQAIKEATPVPTAIPTPPPYSKSDAP